MKFIFVLLLIVLHFFAVSQQANQVVLIGHVSDTDEIPLIGAKTIDLNTGKQATTNKKGLFQLNISSQSTVIRISYKGYNTLEKPITKNDLKQIVNDTLLLSVKLKPETVEFSEVEIIANRNLLAYNKPNILILDYNFISGNLLLLIATNKTYKLRLVDDHSNTISEIALHNKRPEGLFEDCFGNIHLLYKDKVHQLAEDQFGLSLMKGFSREQFNEYLSPCILATKSHLFFAKLENHNQSVIYFSINKGNQSKKLVHKTIDKEGAIATADFYNKTSIESKQAKHVMADNNFTEQGFARNVEKREWFYKSVLKNPTYNPMIKVKDSVFIFDHVVDSVFIFAQNGSIKRAFPINYHYQTGWKNEVIVDNSGENIYAKCLQKGLVYLLQINSNDGKVLEKFKLRGHAFPEKIKIKDEFAYYLYTDHTNQSITNIYRQKLH